MDYTWVFTELVEGVIEMGYCKEYTCLKDKKWINRSVQYLHVMNHWRIAIRISKNNIHRHSKHQRILSLTISTILSPLNLIRRSTKILRWVNRFTIIQIWIESWKITNQTNEVHLSVYRKFVSFTSRRRRKVSSGISR